MSTLAVKREKSFFMKLISPITFLFKVVSAPFMFFLRILEWGVLPATWVINWFATEGSRAVRGEYGKLLKVAWVGSAMAFLTSAVIYMLFPVDFINDLIPVVGTWDDYGVGMTVVATTAKTLRLAYGEEIDFSKWERGFVKASATISVLGIGAIDSFIPVVGSVDDLIALLLVLVPVGYLMLTKAKKSMQR